MVRQKSTGGAGGIGAASAIKFARAGAAVAISDFPSLQKQGEQVLERIKKEVPGAPS